MLLKFIKKYFFEVVFILLTVAIISLVNMIEYHRSGIDFLFKKYAKLEISVMILLGLAIVSILKRNKKLSYIMGLLPVSIFYICSHEFYRYYNRNLKFSDFYQIPELLKILSLLEIIGIVLFLILYTLFFIKQIDLSRYKNTNYLFISVLLLYGIISFKPSFYIDAFTKMNFRYISWDIKTTLYKAGFLNVMFYEEAVKNQALNELETKKKAFDNIKISSSLLKENLPNIHIIVLESFFDPTMFENLNFSHNLTHDLFSKYFGNSYNISETPVYGGGTAQAEFEVLTGVPAYSMYNSVEFNLFTGAKTEGFPNVLKELGYTTYATNAGNPGYFNSYNAYKGLGFDFQYYSTGSTYLENKHDDVFLFDGDLLESNLVFVDSVLKENKPVFNYVLGIYGHSPMNLDTERHPQFIKAYSQEGFRIEGKIERIANQYYYRTKVVGMYIDKLLKIDPKGIIVVVGDHLLQIPDIDSYGYPDIKELKCYFIENGVAIGANKKMHHYEIPHDILHKINSEYYSGINLKDTYNSIIYNAIQ